MAVSGQFLHIMRRGQPDSGHDLGGKVGVSSVSHGRGYWCHRGLGLVYQ